LATVPLLRVVGANSDHDDLDRATDDLVRTIRNAGQPDVRTVRPSSSNAQRSAEFLWVAVPLLVASRPILLKLIDVVGKWAVANRRTVRIKIGDAELDVEGGSARAQSETLDRFLEALGYAKADSPAVGSGPTARLGESVSEPDTEGSDATGH
jgi:hypothetical protein